jgi:lipopolysaccharide export system protein LptC
VRLNTRTLAVAVILVGLAAGSWWLSRFTTVPVAIFDGKQRHDPSYIVENFHNTVMGEDGRPRYELRGARLLHYGDDGTSVIEQPYVIQYTPGQAPTHARAKSGFMPRGNHTIRLTGDVNIARGRDPRGAGAEIRTQEFTLELDKPARKDT